MAVQSFLQRALMPLHKPKCVGMYHQQLAYCVTQASDQKDVLQQSALACLCPSMTLRQLPSQEHSSPQVCKRLLWRRSCSLLIFKFTGLNCCALSGLQQGRMRDARNAGRPVACAGKEGHSTSC